MAEQNSSLSRETCDKMKIWIGEIANQDQANLEIILDQLRHKLNARIEAIAHITYKSTALHAICWLISLGALGIVAPRLEDGWPFFGWAPSNLPFFESLSYGGLVVVGLAIMAIYYLWLARRLASLMRPMRLHSSGQGWEDYDQERGHVANLNEKLLILIAYYANKDEETKQDEERFAQRYTRLLRRFKVGVSALLLIAITILTLALE